MPKISVMLAMSAGLVGAIADADIKAERADYLVFNGEFSQPEWDHDACMAYFEQTQYKTKFFVMNPQGTAFVLHFFRDDTLGFLNGSVAGLIGYADIKGERTWLMADGSSVKVTVDGMVSDEAIFIRAKVERQAGGDSVCFAAADYLGSSSFYGGR